MTWPFSRPCVLASLSSPLPICVGFPSLLSSGSMVVCVWVVGWLVVCGLISVACVPRLALPCEHSFCTYPCTFSPSLHIAPLVTYIVVVCLLPLPCALCPHTAEAFPCLLPCPASSNLCASTFLYLCPLHSTPSGSICSRRCLFLNPSFWPLASPSPNAFRAYTPLSLMPKWLTNARG